MDENTVSSEVQTQKMKDSKLTSIARILLFVAVFGGLIGFIPASFFAGVTVKSALIHSGVLIAFILTMIVALRSNKMTLPGGMFAKALIALPIVYVISALMSPVSGLSFFGFGYEIGTAGFIIVMTLLAYLTTVLLHKKKYIALFQSLIFLSALLLFGIQILTIFAPNAFGLSSVLSNPLSNFIGNHNDLGVFFGAVLLLSLAMVEFKPWGTSSKFFAYIFGVISLFVLSIIGFTYLWVLVGLFAIALFVGLYVYSSKINPKLDRPRISSPALVVVIVSALFILFGSGLTGQIRESLKIQGVIDQPPTVSQTLPVVSKSFKDNPVFGSGPNRFATQWSQYKPDAVNLLPIWSIDYNYGHSFFLTSIVTTGLVGVVVLLALFALFVLTGVWHVFLKNNDKVSYISFSTFILTLYLWLMLVIHVPSSGLMALTFMSTGFFIVSLHLTGQLKTKEWLFDKKPALSFPIVLVVGVSIVLGVSYEYISLSKAYASYSYQKGNSFLPAGDFEKARKHINKAISFGGNDLYHRALSSSYIAELQARAPELTTNPTEEQRLISDQLISNAANAAVEALRVDDTNYQNHLAFGSVQQIYVSPQNDAIYEAAKSTFNSALERAPKNPGVYLSLANLELVAGNREEAINQFARAIEMKPNYSQARFLWAQAQIAQGDVNAAINTLQEAVAVSPLDAGLHFHLGYLNYETGKYDAAIENFENVIRLVPVHANARFYLGLSYAEVGRDDDAVIVLESIKQIDAANTDNAFLQAAINTIVNPPTPEPEPEEDGEDEEDSESLEDLDELPFGEEN